MDDLEVIRLAVIDNIPKERIARARMEVKRNFGGGVEARQAVYLTLLQLSP
jgi:hypothetical protein